MNKKAYEKARWYAFQVCSAIDPLDIVHDSYLKYHERNNTDLFDLDMALIYHVIKLEYYEQIRSHTQFKWKGSRGQYDQQYGTRQFISVNDYDENDIPKIELPAEGSTDELAITNELDNAILKELNNQPDEIRGQTLTAYELMKQGYRGVEIEEEMNRGRTAVHTYKTIIRNATTRNIHPVMDSQTAGRSGLY